MNMTSILHTLPLCVCCRVRYIRAGNHLMVATGRAGIISQVSSIPMQGIQFYAGCLCDERDGFTGRATAMVHIGDRKLTPLVARELLLSIGAEASEQLEIANAGSFHGLKHCIGVGLNLEEQPWAIQLNSGWRVFMGNWRSEWAAHRIATSYLPG